MKYALIFMGLGFFSYHLIINFTDFSPSIANILYSRGALAYTMAAFVLLGFSTLRLSEWINHRYIQDNEKRWRFAVANLLVGLLFLGLNYSLCVVAKILAEVNPIWSFSNSGWQILLMVWMAEMVIIGLLLSNRTLLANQKLRQEASRLQIESSNAKYKALQNQLNPHFLFNSLNTLVAEIQYNPHNAVKFTQHLSNVYRYVLQCHDQHLVTLGAELTFVESFVFLHQVRLGDCISCHTDVNDECLDYQLPPLTLQLLVENVIKHNTISPTKPMVINIAVADETLCVSNHISPKKNSIDEASGIGLKNLSTRCLLVCHHDISITNDNNIFSVNIPLIK